MMPPTSIEEFQRLVDESARLETETIDHYYHAEIEKSGLMVPALAAAMQKAHQKLKYDIPGGVEFGYRMARNVGRWIMYSHAYLASHIESDEQHEALKRQLDHDNIEVLDQNPYYFRFYDILEDARTSQVDANYVPKLINPFQLQDRAAKILIAHALDMIVETGTESIHDNRREQWLTPDPDKLESPASFNIARIGNIYSTKYFCDVYPHDVSGNRSRHRLLRYRIIESATGIVATAAWAEDEPVEFGSQTCLRLAEQLDIDQDALFRRTDPSVHLHVKALAKQL